MKKIFYTLTVYLWTVILFQNCSPFSSNHGQNLQGSNNPLFRAQDYVTPVGGVYEDSYVTTTGEGFNNYFISSYIKHLNGHRDLSSTNITPISLAKIRKAFSYLQGSSLHHAREGLELRQIFPAKGRIEHLEEVVEILKIYQKNNFSLIITFGNPFPNWMLKSFATPWCPMPQSNQDWAILKDEMSQSIGLLFNRLWNHPELDREWLKNKVLIEPFNEFYSLGTRLTPGADCKVAFAGGDRGADLDGGIRYVLKEYDIPMLVTMPSSYGVDWFRDYYVSGGAGQPNIHIYPPYRTSDPSSIEAVISYANEVSRLLREHQKVVPAQFKDSFILGEFGLAEAKGECDLEVRPGGVITGNAHDNFLIQIFKNPDIKSMTQMRLLWKLTDVEPTSYNVNMNPCEARFGAIDADINPKNQLLTYLLEVDGIDHREETVKCLSPWGTNLHHSTVIMAYQQSSVPYGETCRSQTRKCSNGRLSGSYLYRACEVQQRVISPDKKSCTLPWGGLLASGSATRAYQSETVPFGKKCRSQMRSCDDGRLSGFFRHRTCQVLKDDAPLAPTPKFTKVYSFNEFKYNSGYRDASQNQPQGQTVHTKMGVSPGIFSYGPYVKLKRGKYRATFRMMVDVADRNFSDQIATFDVVSDLGQTRHAARTIFRRDFTSNYRYKDLILEFNLPQDKDGIEFRINWKGTSYIRFRQVRIEEI